MYKSKKQILNVLNGQKPDHTPLWLMRQAGRYLPEYRNLREKAEDFINLCLTPQLASEITLQPVRRYGFDAAILFADILLVPLALGVKLEFRENEGPVLEAITNDKDIAQLHYDEKKLAPVYETVSLVKSQLSEETTLIGFCGSPWTVACYMLDGTSKNGFAVAKNWAAEKPESLAKLMEVLVHASEIYLSNQIEAGAEVIQLFDSWAGLLEGEDFKRWVIEPTRDLVSRLKKKYPSVPIIGFPREAGENYRDYVLQTGVDCLSLDQTVDLAYAKENLQTIKPLQGNLDPALLLSGGYEMRAAVRKILLTLGPRHIFNLGHGVMKETPLAHVADLVRFVHEFKF